MADTGRKKAGKLYLLHIERAQLLLDTIEEDASGIVDGIVEDRGLLLRFGNEGIALVEELDAGDDYTCKQGKLEHTYQAAKEAVDPPEADNAEQLRHEPSHYAEEQGHDYHYHDEGRDVGCLDRDTEGPCEPRSYGHIESSAEKQAADEAGKAGYLLHQPVAQAADETHDKEYSDDDVNCFHII